MLLAGQGFGVDWHRGRQRVSIESEEFYDQRAGYLPRRCIGTVSHHRTK